MIKALSIFFILLLCASLSNIFLLMCIDREVARREYVAGVYPMEDCLFDFNCQHYNELAEKDDTDVE